MVLTASQAVGARSPRVRLQTDARPAARHGSGPSTIIVELPTMESWAELRETTAGVARWLRTAAAAQQWVAVTVSAGEARRVLGAEAFRWWRAVAAFAAVEVRVVDDTTAETRMDGQGWFPGNPDGGPPLPGAYWAGSQERDPGLRREPPAVELTGDFHPAPTCPIPDECRLCSGDAHVATGLSRVRGGFVVAMPRTTVRRADNPWVPTLPPGGALWRPSIEVADVPGELESQWRTGYAQRGGTETTVWVVGAPPYPSLEVALTLVREFPGRSSVLSIGVAELWQTPAG